MIKNYLPTSLLGRTILIVLIPVLLLQIAVSIVFFDRHWSEMTQRLSFAVVGEMKTAIDKYQENPGSLDDIQNIMLNNFDIKLDLKQDALPLPDYTKTSPPRWSFDYTIYNDLSREIERALDMPFGISVQTPQKKIYVYIALANEMMVFTIPERRLFSSSSYIFILWMIGFSILFFTIALLFMRNQIRPIYRLGLIAERLGRGIPVDKIKPSGAREVRQAAEAFTSMQQRINQFVDQRTMMLAAVSHDLKTPLTRMKLQLEFIDNADDRKALEGDIKDMEEMIGGYLAFTRGDGGEEMQRINLAELLDQITEDAKRLNLKIADAISIDDSKSIYLWGKPQALKRLFDNILANAAHYSDEIHLSCVIDKKNYIHINIIDNGPGVPEENYPELAKPFYRGDDSRNLRTGGVGLGLAIAHDIAASHGGHLNFYKSNDFTGLGINVQIPL